MSSAFVLPPFPLSQGLPPDRGIIRPGSLDAEIDSLTSMLADLDGGRSHAPRRPDRQVTSCVLSLLPHPQPVPCPSFSASVHPLHCPPTLFATNKHLVQGITHFLLGRPRPWELVRSHCYPGVPTWHAWILGLALLFLHCLSSQAFEAPPPHAYRGGSLKPSGGAVPTPMLPASHYGGPTPASYATASTPAGPAFPVQVKVAQPVRGCGLPRRGASQASGPLPGPHFPLTGRGEVWGAGYRSHREPGPGVPEGPSGVHIPAGGGRGGGHEPQVSWGWALWFVVTGSNWALIRWRGGRGVLKILFLGDVGRVLA